MASILIIEKRSYSVDIFLYSSANTDPYDSDKMAAEFLMMFNSQAYSLEQIMAFSFADKKLLGLFVKEIEGKNYEKKFKVVPYTTGR